MLLVLHVLTGALGLLFGYVALFSAKGASTHRRTGMAFVYSMLPMTVFGLAIALTRNVAPSVNVPAALLTAYLVVTALTTVRPLPAGGRAARWLDTGGMLVALGLGLVMVSFAAEALANGGKRNGMPAFPFFLFGFIGLAGAAGDIRVIRAGALTGARRLARHLWRMSFALFIAALSSTFQLAKMLPGSWRGLVFVQMPLVLLTMLYWLWRVRIRRSLAGLIVTGRGSPAVGGSLPRAAGLPIIPHASKAR